MKKIITVIFISLLFSQIHFAQIEDRFAALAENNVKEYVRPFVTSLGSAMNSGGFYNASVPKFFGFSFSLRAMIILIPEDQTKFTPSFSVPGYSTDEATATIYGDKGGAYAGPNGYITTPGGINAATVPMGYPQISASLLGTEVMLRYLPKISIAANNDLDMFGIGIKHNISQYIPLFPIDLAVQFLYNKLTVSNLIDLKNTAFNAHASRTFGIITPYFGLQYESTTMDLDYTIEGDPNSGDPELQADREIKTSIDGDNTFRAVFGASLKLAVIVLNADVNFSSQTVISGGLSFEF
jgi:hypothetical protein